jgi:hypothetical protein
VIRCTRCGQHYQTTVELADYHQLIPVYRCNTCPVDRVTAVCGPCATPQESGGLLICGVCHRGYLRAEGMLRVGCPPRTGWWWGWVTFPALGLFAPVAWLHVALLTRRPRAWAELALTLAWSGVVVWVIQALPEGVGCLLVGTAVGQCIWLGWWRDVVRGRV